MALSRPKFLVLAAGLLVLGGAAAFFYYNGGAHAQGGHAGGPPQAMPVPVLEVHPEEITLWKKFSGRLEAVDFAEIRPQVSGAITAIRFTDGQMVAEGDVLFIIDQAPYKAAVAQAEADLKVAENQNDLAQKDLSRAESLMQSQALSKSVYDARRNAANVTAASVEAARARLASSRINLDRSAIKAPISGRVSRAELTVGNIVEAGIAPPVLTSIVSDKGVYAEFDVDEKTYLAARPSDADLESAENIANPIPVKIALKSDPSRLFDGRLHSFDNRIDPATGTIRARALVEETGGTLLPGMFVDVEMGTVSGQSVILVPEKAIGTDQDRKFVYVIDDKGMAAYMPVVTGQSVEERRVIIEGLKGGEKVITGGMVKIRPGMPVTAQTTEAQPPAAALSQPETQPGDNPETTPQEAPAQ